MHSASELTSTPSVLHKARSRIGRGFWPARLAIVVAVFSLPAAAHAQAACEVVAAFDAHSPNGTQVHIYTDRPLVIIEPERD